MGCHVSKTASEAADAMLPKSNVTVPGPTLLTTHLTDAEVSIVSKAASPSVALCMEGGGIKAFCTYAGVVAASLAAGKKYGHVQPKLDQMYQRFGQLSSVSGGSWFVASLVYSPHFAKTIEAIGADHQLACDIFQQGFIDNWMKRTSEHSDLVKTLEEHLGRSTSGLSGALEKLAFTIAALAHFAEEAKGKDALFTWTDVVQELFESAALIPANCQAGTDEMMPWARDKVWIVNHAVVTPTEGNWIDVPGLNLFETKVHMATKTALLEDASYTLEDEGGDKIPNLFPAAYNVRLGAGPSAPAPSFYSTLECLPKLKYAFRTTTNSSWLNCARMSEAHSATSSNGCCAGACRDVGKLRVVDIAAASSGALGWVHCLPSFIDDALGAAALQLTPFVSCAPDGRAFSDARALVNKIYTEGATKDNLNAVADAGVHALTDAGLIENTGIAGAVARGATEVVVFLCNSTPENLTQLFEGECDLGPSDFAFSAKLFGDHNLPIFSSPQAKEVLQAYNVEDAGTKDLYFKPMKISGAKVLHGLKVGTVTCTTTDAKWFGIRAGQSVKIHVVSVEHDCDLFFENLYLYSELVQEIVDCIMDENNADLAKNILLPFLSGEHSLLM